MTRVMTIQIRPRWEEISDVRRQTANFLVEQNLPRDVVDALAMVACELTENATKYGKYEAPSDRIDVHVSFGKPGVMVEVTHPVDASREEHLTRLDRMVQWIRGFQDPFEAYLQRLKEMTTEGLNSTESRLGLVRIAYEGQSVLDFYVDDRNLLAVSAIRRL